ncbi:MAG: hypothetical protein ACLUIX_05025 [Oscillospiraceae bacterium]
MVAELAALVIFVIMFLLIVLDRIPRQWVTLGCGALMLVLVFGVCMHDGGAIWDTLNLSAFGQSTFWYGASESSGGINWSTIVFIAGMMVMVEAYHVGIFRWLCLKLVRAHYRTVPRWCASWSWQPCCPCSSTASPSFCFWPPSRRSWAAPCASTRFP